MEQRYENKQMTIVLKPLWWVLVGQLFLMLPPLSLRVLTSGIDVLPDPIGYLLIFIGLYKLRVFDAIRPEFPRARTMTIVAMIVSCLTVWTFATENVALIWTMEIALYANIILGLLVTYYILCGLRRIAFGCGMKTLHQHLMKRWSLIVRVRIIGQLGYMLLAGYNIVTLIIVELVIAVGHVLAMMAVYRSMLEMQGATYDERRFDEIKQEPGTEQPQEEAPKKKASIWDEEHDDPDEYDDDDLVVDEDIDLATLDDELEVVPCEDSDDEGAEDEGAEDKE